MGIQSALPTNQIGRYWNAEILPTLFEYIQIPNLSVDSDSEWESHGYMDNARWLALDWLEAHPVSGWAIHSRTLVGRTPLILMDVPGDSNQTLLIYGHLDNQPEMEGWREGLGPWAPVVKGNKLCGRGGADDGYAMFAAVAVLQAIKA
jgi:acetylornithine deacetylase/succinyl-diaminopimelate desuccinylase-like protein